MIIRTRRKNESLIKRLLKPWSHVPPPGYPNVLSPDQFELEVVKERFRANRRQGEREFAIVAFDFSDNQVSDSVLEDLIFKFGQRIRISDSIGWHKFRLKILLPETSKAGAYMVANQLIEICDSFQIDVDTEVSVYPWDDSLTSKFGEHFDVSQQIDDEPGRGDGDSSGGHEASAFESTSAKNGFSSVATVNETKVAVESLPQTQLRVTNDKKTRSIAIEIAKRGTGSEFCFLPEIKTPLWKRCIDVAGSACGLIMLSPVLLGAAVAIKATSSGPVFFSQQREGKDGKPFAILKFRTMVTDAEEKKDALRELSEQDGPAFKLKDDPRITSIGRYLRKSCIDELPQLFNVLKGEMSLVGPRPLPVGESEQCLAWQRQRLLVLPGLTCIWQARGGRDTKFAEWMRMDMDYIRKRGFLFDLRLLMETVLVVVLHRGSV